MTATITIVLVLILLYIFARFVTAKMWALKQTPHTDTPQKLGLDFEEVRFPTQNDRSLYGWWIPAKKSSSSAPTLVLVHGWSRNLGRMLRYVQHLAPLNYNLLAFDARHHGSSDADDHASMYKFGQDVQAAVKYVQTRSIDSNKIGVIGLSIGGAGSIFASGMDPAIKALVTVGAPAHPVDVMTQEFKKHGVPNFLIWFMLKQVEFKIGAKYETFAPVNNIGQSDAAFYIIHGDQDKVVLPDQAEKLRKAARPENLSSWIIPGKAHSDCHHEPEFWTKLDNFFQTKLVVEENKK